MFTFDVFWGSLGTSIFGNWSSTTNNTWTRLPSRLFSVSYDHDADGLAFVTEILEGLKERLEAWKGALESKGSRVDVRKTKMMIDSENVGKITVERAFFLCCFQKDVWLT